jgi:origin recognition complex subunit 1
MRNCPKFGKVILVAMVHELYKSGLGEVTFEKVSAVSFGVLLSSMLVFNIMGVNKI